MLATEEPPPWAGQTATYAAPAVMELIRGAGTTLVFINTRAQAEVFFQHLWAQNDEGLPIGCTTARSAARCAAKVEAAMAAGELRAIVATGSLDLGIDWGDVDLVVQVGAPKNVKRLVQRIGRANHRYNAPSRAVIVPANRFEVLECRAALDAVLRPRPRRRAARAGAARRALPAHPAHRLRRARSRPTRSTPRCGRRGPTAPCRGPTSTPASTICATGGYALKAYDRWQRLVERDGLWSLARSAPGAGDPHERRHDRRRPSCSRSGSRGAAARRSARSRRISPRRWCRATPSSSAARPCATRACAR